MASKQRYPSETINIMMSARQQQHEDTILAYSAPSNVSSWNYRHPSAAISEHLDMAKPAAQLYLVSKPQLHATDMSSAARYNGFPPNRKLVSIIPRPEISTSIQQQQQQPSPFLFTAGGQPVAQRLPSRSDKKCRKVIFVLVRLHIKQQFFNYLFLNCPGILIVGPY